MRPSYPPALADDVIALSHLTPDARVLEVGCGTGQATRLFAARDLPHHRRRSRPRDGRRHPRAGARRDRARQAASRRLPLPPANFALVYSATAWHWIDPARPLRARPRAPRSPAARSPLFWNEHVRGADDVGFFDATQDLYEAAGMDAPSPEAVLPNRQSHARASSPAATSARSCAVTTRGAPNTTRATYARLIGTYSDHLRLAPDVRARLLDGVAALIDARFSAAASSSTTSPISTSRARTRVITPRVIRLECGGEELRRAAGAARRLARRSSRASCSRSSAARARASRRSCTSWAASIAATRARPSVLGHDLHALDDRGAGALSQPRGRLRLPGVQPARSPDRARERQAAGLFRRRPTRPTPTRARVDGARRASASATRPSRARARSRAGRSSASPSRARSITRPSCSCATSRPATSTPRPARKSSSCSARSTKRRPDAGHRHARRARLVGGVARAAPRRRRARCA